MTRPQPDGAARRRLRLWLALFFVALLAPSLALLLKALDQLKWEALRESQLAAEEVATRIDGGLSALVRTEDARAFAEFAFLILAGEPEAGFLQRSPLSAFPVEPVIPGLIGWFQIDAAGRLSTPLLPSDNADVARYGVGVDELAGRQALERRIAGILDRNALVDASIARELTPTAGSKVATSPTGPEALHAPDDAIAGLPSNQTPKMLPARQQPAEREAADLASTSPAQAPTAQAVFERLAGTVLGTEQSPSTTPSNTERERQKERLEGRASSAPEQRLETDRSHASSEEEITAGPERRSRVEQTALPEPVVSAEVARERKDRLREPGQSHDTQRLSKPHAHQDSDTVDSMAAVPQAAQAEPETRRGSPSTPLIRTFESELDPFRFNRLDSGHLVLFRWAWRDGARYVQGALIAREPFLDAMIGDVFRASRLAASASLSVAWGDETLTRYASEPNARRYDYDSRGRLPQGTVLARTRPSEPFSNLTLTFSATRLPAPPGATLIYWLGATLFLVIGLGTWLVDRLALRQLALARQQQDFVAAVSHELKTPLTSIRMYSEMLCEGWVSDDKRPSYYRFIHDESERLSRLVANVLQLARISRDRPQVIPRLIPIDELLGLTRESLINQASRGGFELKIDCACQAPVRVDPDAVAQILINLVDNAIKFAGASKPKRIDISCFALGDRGVELRVRDYGPGIPKSERRRVFRLFHRLENETTRATRGTGIGLALVDQLTKAMNGEVELIGCEPGTEVRLRFPPAEG